jgi:glycerophosphoryl diester phosphodiesterase
MLEAQFRGRRKAWEASGNATRPNDSLQGVILAGGCDCGNTNFLVTVVIAHRGASKAAKENTLAAFRLAASMGAEWVELDVRRTQDGALAIHHDPYLSDGRVICDTPAADLPRDVTDLDAALVACAGMGVNIEIKNSPGEIDFDPSESLVDPVVALIRQRGDAARVLISCFHLPTIDRVREIAPEIRTAWLVEKVSAGTLDKLIEHGHSVLHPWVKKVDEALVVICHSRGIEVNTWTCDDPDRMRDLIGWGIDGICTNVPDVARRVVDKG